MKITPRILFVTGTDTGVGKTIFTALALANLRARQIRAFAIKPFCSGSRADVNLLSALQNNELTPEEINPFFFREPLAPLAAARLHRRSISLTSVLNRIQSLASHCECLLVEGVGGLMVPLGRDYTVLDLIARLDCEVIVVARNQLGTLNHTLLTLHMLEMASPATGKISRVSPYCRRTTVVLMHPRLPDRSTASNPRLLAELVQPTPVRTLPYLGPNCGHPRAIRARTHELRHQLARILG